MQKSTSVAVAVAQAHVEQRNLVHLMHRERADAALLTVTLRLHVRLRQYIRPPNKKWKAHIGAVKGTTFAHTERHYMMQFQLLACTLQRSRQAACKVSSKFLAEPKLRSAAMQCHGELDAIKGL